MFCLSGSRLSSIAIHKFVQGSIFRNTQAVFRFVYIITYEEVPENCTRQQHPSRLADAFLQFHRLSN